MNGSDGRNLHLVLAGCGTVGLAVARAAAGTRLARQLAALTLIDCDVIEQRNQITCPQYRRHEGEPKAAVLANLARRWLPGELRLQALCEPVQQVDWAGALEACVDGHSKPGKVAVVAGLDDWPSRLCLVEDVRKVVNAPACDGRRPKPTVVVVQVAVDRDEAQVSVFGSAWEDPCPACGLAALPEREPCVLLGRDGHSVRGNLQREAWVAAALVMEVIGSFVSETDFDRWLNTKTNLVAASPGCVCFQRHCQRKRRVATCLGPHSPAHPLHVDKLFRREEPSHA